MIDLLHEPFSQADPAPLSPDDFRMALDRQRDDYLRLAADFDNFRKRTRRDAEQQAAAAKEAFILDLLPILDNLERALTHGHSTSAQLRQGVEMTLRQSAQLLERHGVEAVNDVGQSFDPHRHEAVALGHEAGQPDHSILHVIQCGYRRGSKVFRPAKVQVNALHHSAGTGP